MPATPDATHPRCHPGHQADADRYADGCEGLEIANRARQTVAPHHPDAGCDHDETEDPSQCNCGQAVHQMSTSIGTDDPSQSKTETDYHIDLPSQGERGRS